MTITEKAAFGIPVPLRIYRRVMVGKRLRWKRVREVLAVNREVKL